MTSRPCTLTKGGVLLMGGDIDLQHRMRAALEADNYEVLPAASRDEARELLDAGSIDILVLEVHDDPESLGCLLAQLKARRPQLRTIGIRGHQHVAALAELADVDVWVKKPPNLTRLVATVNNLLAELRSEMFREELLRRQSAPLFSSVPYAQCGLNE